MALCQLAECILQTMAWRFPPDVDASYAGRELGEPGRIGVAVLADVGEQVASLHRRQLLFDRLAEAREHAERTTLELGKSVQKFLGLVRAELFQRCNCSAVEWRKPAARRRGRRWLDTATRPGRVQARVVRIWEKLSIVPDRRAVPH